jgi:beta-lactamase class A
MDQRDQVGQGAAARMSPRGRLDMMTKMLTLLALIALSAAPVGAGGPLPADPPGAPATARAPQLAAPLPAWAEQLQAALERVDEQLPGELGVYVQDIASGESHSFRGDELWYMASVIKVPVAVQVLRDIQQGKLSFDDRIELLADDFVDGAGETNQHPPGTRLRVDYLLRQMLVYSDNTASDVLIRTVDLSRVNATARELIAGEIGDITTLADVRRYAYSGFHPGAAQLRSAELLAIRRAGFGDPRVVALAEVLGVPRAELLMPDLDTAFEAFYAAHHNAAPISAYGRLFAAIAKGEALDETHTRWLLDTLSQTRTGDNRIKAGLPGGAKFAHKTGTQHRRNCDVGIVTLPGQTDGPGTVVAACTRGVASLAASERAFRAVGKAVGESGVLDLRASPAPFGLEENRNAD